MNNFNGFSTFNNGSDATALFIPIINVLQENSLDRRFNISVDFQNSDLYTLQELTRCAALINYIDHNSSTSSSAASNTVNNVFDTFVRLEDPMAVFIENFEQFFAMYIHSKYGHNNFKLFMKECEKSQVAYPINVFEAGMCIFMQYNRQELRRYVYNIITMFYYYTGQDFYEMIRPTINRTARPNAFDEFGDEIDKDVVTPRKYTYEQKLCRLNKRNYNVTKPFIQRTYNPLDMATRTRFEKCILTGGGSLGRQYDEVYVGGTDNQRPVVELSMNKQQDVRAKVMNCNEQTGISQDDKIYKFSEHLQRSRNFEANTIVGNGSGGMDDDIEQQQTNEHYQRKTHVQTNFSKIWKSDNRRHLVALAIVNSIMDVCIQKITYSLIEDKTCTKDEGAGAGSGSHDNVINNDYRNSSDLPSTKSSTSSSSSSSFLTSRKLIKPKKVTVEVSFHRASKTCRNDKL